MAATTLPGAEVDSVGNNVAFKELLVEIEDRQLLSQVARSGLLSKAQEAGVSLSNLEPLLKLASDNPDILVLVEASGPELLPVLPTVVKLAPSALPLLASAISIPPILLQVAGLGSIGLTAVILQITPDDTVVNVAAQTLAVGLLGIAAPVASFRWCKDSVRTYKVKEYNGKRLRFVLSAQDLILYLCMSKHNQYFSKAAAKLQTNTHVATRMFAVVVYWLARRLHLSCLATLL